jgi:4-alpha-glucanotransferase
MNDDRIYQLAQAAGMMREWINAEGKTMHVAPDALRAVLQALDLPCANETDCDASLQALEAVKNPEALPPLATGTVDVPFCLPGIAALAGKSYRIECESGGHIDGRFADDAAGGIALPAIDRPGFHRLLAGDGETVLAVAPERCFGIADALHIARGKEEMHLWGLGVQLYSLRRSGDGGIGDYASLAKLAEAAAAQGASALAISPVHAMFSADPGRYSPYGPSSRLFPNVWHIDPASVAGPQEFAAALAALGGDAAGKLARYEQNELIDWPGSVSLRLALLRRLYERFKIIGDEGEFEAFRVEAGNALRDHARFEALHAWRLAQGQSGDWRTWPAGLRDPHGAEVERFARDHADEVRFHEFLQWQAARGLSGAQQAARKAGMPIGLIADLAVGADNGGSQAWSRQAEIINGLSVGAPPDIMNPRGQSWGLGAFSPHAMKARGFGAYIEMLRSTFQYAGGARIDHVLGLSRLWLVPQGESPENGAYLKYPMHDLLRLIALESWRHRAIVIGENLGTVPPGFDDIIARYGLLGIQVLLFQQKDGRFMKPAEWSENAIATTTTHDLPTIAGWWQGRNIDWRVKLDLLAHGQSEGDARADRERDRAALWQALSDAGEVSGALPEARVDSAPLDAAIAFMSSAPAPLAMLPIEDALGLVEQPNLPGTVESHPNWRRRLPHDVDSVLRVPQAEGRLAIMNRSRSRVRRGGAS